MKMKLFRIYAENLFDFHDNLQRARLKLIKIQVRFSILLCDRNFSIFLAPCNE